MLVGFGRFQLLMKDYMLETYMLLASYGEGPRALVIPISKSH